MRLVLIMLPVAILMACAEPIFELQESVELISPAGSSSAQPHLSVSSDNQVILSWLEPMGNQDALKFSTIDGGSWSQPKTLASGSNWFVNWADFPSVVPINGALWAAHWLVTQEDGYGYDTVLSTSKDSGASWSEPSPLHLDGTPTEHGFVTLFPSQSGIGAVWLDGRNFIQDGEFVFETSSGELPGMSLRHAQFDANGERLLAQELNKFVCDCCQTDVALSQGNALLVYRGRTSDEIRDIYFQRFTGNIWESPKVIHSDGWVIGGCPINGPAIDALGDDVAVAWFSAANDRPLVKLAWSNNGGENFSGPLEVDSEGSFGHVDVASIGNGSSAVSWLRSEGDGMSLMVRKVQHTGEMSVPIVVANIDIARPLDFPQMAYDGSRLIFAWTDTGDAERVRTAVVTLKP